MTQETLNKIRQEYLEAFTESKNILDIVKSLYNRLSILDIPAEDKDQFGLFLSGIKVSILSRERTVDYSNLAVTLNHAMFYIISFMNKKRGADWDANIVARRKSLRRELTKILRKSVSSSDTVIGDLFGIRIVSQNDLYLNDEQMDVELHDISGCVQDIICDRDPKLRANFLEYLLDVNVKDQSGIPNLVYNALSRNTFALSEGSYKDYVRSPKDNGYKTIQFTIHVVSSLSPIFAGAQIEFQVRSQTMDQNAEYGHYNHRDYENETAKEIRDVFKLTDDIFERIKISGFTMIKQEPFDDEGNPQPEKVLIDIDGISCGKIIATRRSSDSLVSQSFSV